VVSAVVVKVREVLDVAVAIAAGWITARRIVALFKGRIES
jgi:hypothetical protein